MHFKTGASPAPASSQEDAFSLITGVCSFPFLSCSSSSSHRFGSAFIGCSRDCHPEPGAAVRQEVGAHPCCREPSETPRDAAPSQTQHSQSSHTFPVPQWGSCWGTALRAEGRMGLTREPPPVLCLVFGGAFSFHPFHPFSFPSCVDSGGCPVFIPVRRSCQGPCGQGPPWGRAAPPDPPCSGRICTALPAGPAQQGNSLAVTHYIYRYYMNRYFLPDGFWLHPSFFLINLAWLQPQLLVFVWWGPLGWVEPQFPW